MVIDMVSGDVPAIKPPAHAMIHDIWFYARWMVPMVIFAVALVTSQYWLPDPLSKVHAAQFQNIDSEHGAVCQRFGFQPTTDQFATCKAELLRLWNYHKNSEVIL
jgi:hypothetical protein